MLNKLLGFGSSIGKNGIPFSTVTVVVGILTSRSRRYRKEGELKNVRYFEEKPIEDAFRLSENYGGFGGFEEFSDFGGFLDGRDGRDGRYGKMKENFNFGVSFLELFGNGMGFGETLDLIAKIVEYLWYGVMECEDILNVFVVESIVEKLSGLSYAFAAVNFIYRLGYGVSARSRKLEEAEKEEHSKRSVEKIVLILLRDLDEFLKKVLSHYQRYESENLMSEINMFMVVFLQFMLESQIYLEGDEEESLLKLIDPLFQILALESSYFSLVVASFEQIVRLTASSDYVSYFQDRKYSNIKLMLKRIGINNCTDQELLSMIKFFLAYASTSKVIKLIFYIFREQSIYMMKK